MKNKPEVLSPAGSWESLKAAAAAGADAVYFGGSSFNARRNAENFTDADIPQVVSYCHARGIKAYFTLNTIIFDNEIEKAMKLAALVCAAGVDAILLQDAGLAKIIRHAAPKAVLHASTQMSVHNISGVRELTQMGFSRVVLARELSLSELAAIAHESPIELEVFVHGALCMSVSGQCYMSAFFGGCRSGNRGLCAQPCRLSFSAGMEKNVLSLKDLSIIDHIREIENLGISSFKIEGRMKRPEYVAAATAACRKAVDGMHVTAQEKEELRAVFSRDGFTSGYFDGNPGRDMFGIRKHEDVVSTAPILKRFRSLYEGVERQRVEVDFDFSMQKNGTLLKACDSDKNIVTVSGKQPETAKNHAIDKKTVSEKLAKTGSTPFILRSVKTSLEPGMTLPVAEINRLRRESLTKLLEKRGEVKSIPFYIGLYEAVRQQHFSTEMGNAVETLRLRFHSASQIPAASAAVNADGYDLKKAELLFLPVREISEGKADFLIKQGVRIGAELPRAVFSQTDILIGQLKKAKSLGVHDALCGNVGAVECARRAGFVIHGDFGLNVSNSAALSAYAENGLKSCVLSFETPVSAIHDIVSRKSAPCGVIVYGRLPLMLVRNCPGRSFCGCQKNGCSITDRMGCKFPLLCSHDKNGASEILNSRPLWLADRKREILLHGIDFAQLYFTTENASQVSAVLDAWQTGGSCKGEFTRGLYFRPVE